MARLLRINLWVTLGGVEGLTSSFQLLAPGFRCTRDSLPSSTLRLIHPRATIIGASSLECLTVIGGGRDGDGDDQLTLSPALTCHNDTINFPSSFFFLLYVYVVLHL